MKKTIAFFLSMIVATMAFSLSATLVAATYGHTYDHDDMKQYKSYSNWDKNSDKDAKKQLKKKQNKKKKFCKKYPHKCKQERLNCREAVAQGLLLGEVSGNTATVTNNGNKPYVVSLAAYKMFAAYVEDQLLFDIDRVRVKPGQTVELEVDVPACGYQIDLLCGSAFKWNPDYTSKENKVIDFDFGNQDNFCQQEDVCMTKKQNKHCGKQSTCEAAVIAQNGFPQPRDDGEPGAQYSFECVIDGFTPESYNWYFGDGNVWLSVDGAQNTVFYKYGPGSYTVACSAISGHASYAAATRDIVVA